MNINKQVINELIEIFDDNKKDVDKALLYLISVYFKIEDASSCIEERILRTVNVSKIVTREFEKENYTLNWRIPLFVNENHVIIEDSNWSWVESYRNLFFINPARVSTLEACIKSMKKFFAKYPHIRADDVIEATKIYISPYENTQQNKEYVMNANNFIFKKENGVEISMLHNFVQLVHNNRNTTNGENVRTKVTD